MTLYLAVTPDELELPLYVAETEEEMAAWAGIKVKTVREQCSRNKNKPPSNREGWRSGKKIQAAENRNGGRTMKVKLLRHTCEPEMLAGYAAAKCYKGKDPRKSLEVAMEGGHESVLEHAVFTFEVDEVSRVLLAQITRHRLASFSVQSQRYTGADMSMVTPKSMYSYDLVDDIADVRRAVEKLYKHARAIGIPHEDCRYFTLQGGHTGFVMTMNARELRHFFSLRMCARAQWEIRELACEMWKQCKEVAPFMFADAGPGCVRGNCPEGAKSCGHPWKVVSRAKA